MALEGSLKDFGLPDIFQLIGLQKKTGVLYLNNDDDAVTIAFQDDGPGVAEADREKLFQPFFTRRDGGTGLGLAWVQRAVVDHGGTVQYTGGPPGGACFEIRLPLERASQLPSYGL